MAAVMTAAAGNARSCGAPVICADAGWRHEYVAIPATEVERCRKVVWGRTARVRDDGTRRWSSQVGASEDTGADIVLSRC